MNLKDFEVRFIVGTSAKVRTRSVRALTQEQARKVLALYIGYEPYILSIKITKEY